MDLKDKIIAVTGATGFLGSHVTLDLLDAGAKVRCVVRSPDKAQWLVDKGATVAKADLNDEASLVEAFRGADAIIANAALYTLSYASWDAFYTANKVGTENTLNAAAKAGVKRVVYVSTCGVYRPWLGRIGEDAPRLRESDRWWYRNSYMITKAIAEDVAWERAKALDLQLTACRPAGIFGPRDPESAPRIAAILRWPVAPAPWFRFPFSHAGDVAKGLRGALVNDASIGRAYNLSGDPQPMSELLHAWKRVAGKGAWLVPIPLPLGMDFDNSAARRDLGFTNRSYEDTIRDIFASGTVS